MRIDVEGVGAYEVTVPPNVRVGDAFIIEIEAPPTRTFAPTSAVAARPCHAATRTVRPGASAAHGTSRRRRSSLMEDLSEPASQGALSNL